MINVGPIDRKADQNFCQALKQALKTHIVSTSDLADYLFDPFYQIVQITAQLIVKNLPFAAVYHLIKAGRLPAESSVNSVKLLPIFGNTK